MEGSNIAPHTRAEQYDMVEDNIRKLRYVMNRSRNGEFETKACADEGIEYKDFTRWLKALSLNHENENISEVQTAKKSVGLLPDDTESLVKVKVEVLHLSQRATNCLRRAHIDTIGDLLSVKEEDLRNIRQLGTVSYDEIRMTLEANGLAVGLLAGK